MLIVILLAALGQVSASDGPPRQWLPATVDGKTVYLWGWRDVSGGVRHMVAENRHVYGPPPVRPMPSPARPKLSPGQLIGADGEINNGLDLRAARPTMGLDTNDPDLPKKLGLDPRPMGQAAPSAGQCQPDQPDQPPFIDPKPDPLLPYRDYLIPVAILVAVLLLIGFKATRH